MAKTHYVCAKTRLFGAKNKGFRMKKIIALLLLLVTLALSCATLTGCAAPKVEELYDRVVYLGERKKALGEEP